MGKKFEFEAWIMEVDPGYIDLKPKGPIPAGLHKAMRNGPYHTILEPIEPELKPCPFCGGKPKKGSEINQYDGARDHYIYCIDCGGQSNSYISYELAIDAWNRRA